MPIRSIKSIAVFCGSNYGAVDEFADGARALGQALGSAGITVVYGGTTKGLMGVVADAALAAGGNVHGVITESLHLRGQSHSGLTHHEIVQTLRSRKERMVELADAFIALPGGIGTIEAQIDEMQVEMVAYEVVGVDSPQMSTHTAPAIGINGTHTSASPGELLRPGYDVGLKSIYLRH